MDVAEDWAVSFLIIIPSGGQISKVYGVSYSSSKGTAELGMLLS